MITLLLYVVPVFLTVLFLVIFLKDLHDAHRNRAYLDSIQEQINKLRNICDMHRADSKRLADAFAYVQQTHLGLPESQTFRPTLH